MAEEVTHECETPVDGSIQHRWKCKCGKVWEVVSFNEFNGNSEYEEIE